MTRAHTKWSGNDEHPSQILRITFFLYTLSNIIKAIQPVT